MNSEIKILLTGLLIGAGCMYGYLWKQMVVSSAFVNGQVEVMKTVCAPVVQAIAQKQTNESQPSPAKGPKTKTEE